MRIDRLWKKYKTVRNTKAAFAERYIVNSNYTIDWPVRKKSKIGKTFSISRWQLFFEVVGACHRVLHRVYANSVDEEVDSANVDDIELELRQLLESRREC